MYRGFDLSFDPKEDGVYVKSLTDGYSLYNDNTNQIRATLTQFVNNDNSLDGAAIQNAWFPQIECDVFISHSHKNKEQAIALAGWLWNNFKLRSFIDSCIWGYANDLLKKIDDDYKRDDGFYSYSIRNLSTSHVHMMLSVALTMMMDKTECVFFLNSPDSIKTFDGDSKTESPWLYAEIALTHVLRENIPPRLALHLLEETASYSSGDELKKAKELVIRHKVDLSHLTPLTIDDLNAWQEVYTVSLRDHPLNILYQQHKRIKK